MAIGFGAAGVAGSGSTPLAPALPASLAAGDLMALVIENRPSTATPTTPTGWDLRSTVTGGTGSEGIGTGTTRASIYTREWVSGDAAPSVVITGNSSGLSYILRMTKGAGETWFFGDANSGGGDTTLDTAFSVTGASEDWNVGDWALVAAGWALSTSTVSARAFSWTGTVAPTTMTNRAGTSTTSGNDSRMTVETGTITTGGTGAPTVALTLSAATSGAAAVLRLSVTDPGGAADVTYPPHRRGPNYRR